MVRLEEMLRYLKQEKPVLVDNAQTLELVIHKPCILLQV
jgi:hypothetical protein